MPLVIEQLTTSLEIQDEVKIRKLVQDEVRRAVAELRGHGGFDAAQPDPSDPAAGGGPSETGGG